MNREHFATYFMLYLWVYFMQNASSPVPPVVRVPSPQELSQLAQSILQSALIKKQLEEQKERFARRQQERYICLSLKCLYLSYLTYCISHLNKSRLLITSSVQWDHRRYHASAYSTSLLLSTLSTMTSWSPVSRPGLVSMALFSAGSNHICHLAAFV